MLNQANLLTVAEMQAAEQSLIDSGVPVEELMRRAGQGAARMIWRISATMPTLVLCGPGNNGGDGYVVAQWLLEKGVDVRVVAPADPKTNAALQAKSLWRGQTLAPAEASPMPQFVDCLFGTGLDRAISDDWMSHFARLVAGARRRIAIDLPSGAGSDDGRCFNETGDFDTTIALGAYKPSHFLEPARSKMGDLVGIDIGIGAESDLGILPKPRLVGPASTAHKYSRGLIAVVAGTMAGAAQLTAMAAQKAGAGYIKILAPAGFEAPHPSIVTEPIEGGDDLQAALADSRISAVVIGPGLGRGEAAKELLAAAWAVRAPLVVDADALTLAGPQFADHTKKRSAETIATPHAGEFANLLPEAPDSKVADCRKLAALARSTMLLKGSDTVIASPNGRASIARPSSSWLSTAGTGDVLAGIIASRLATGSDGYSAACEGQWLHSRAARLAGPAFTPEMLIDRVPTAIEECL